MDPFNFEETLFLRCNKKYRNCKTVTDVINNENWIENGFLFSWDIALIVKIGSNLL